MQQRRYSFVPSALAAALLAAVVACSSNQVGDTLEAKTKTETKNDTGAGVVEGKVETYVGTVTIYEPGKKIEVMTGDKKTHTAALDAKDTALAIDATVAVGSRVRLTEQTGDDKARRVSVTLEG